MGFTGGFLIAVVAGEPLDPPDDELPNEADQQEGCPCPECALGDIEAERGLVFFPEESGR